MRTITFLLSFTLFIFSMHVFSQRKDYIVTLKKDTMYGRISFDFASPNELTSDTGIYKIEMGSIDSYFLADKNSLFRSRIMPGKKHPTFLHCIENGQINLYEISSKTMVTTGPGATGLYSISTPTTMYAEKADGVLLKLKNWKSRDKLKEAIVQIIGANQVLTDQALAEIFNDNKFLTKEDFRYYIHEYNKQAAAK